MIAISATLLNCQKHTYTQKKKKKQQQKEGITLMGVQEFAMKIFWESLLA
jgi:hypothetical protein